MQDSENQGFQLDQVIMHHVTDSRVWDLPFLPPITLPSYLSLHGVMLIICAVFLIILFCGFYNKTQSVPTGLTNFLEAMVLFVRNHISIACLGEEDGRKMAPLFCTFFFFILGLNLMGLIPLFSTATANLNVTGGLALITLSVMIFGAVYRNGLKGFIKALSPSGVPKLIQFLIVPIEFLSLFIKSFALMMRLFANMLAGHIIIMSVLGVVIILGYKASPTIVLGIFISILEILVAVIQAYIFTFLSALFIGQVHHPQH